MSTGLAPTPIRLTTPALGEVALSYSDQGNGRAILLLHGGGGPLTVSAFAAQLAAAEPGARVITPIHPGFNGTPRPEALHDVAGLAGLYVELIDALGLEDVTVIGNSIGGWLTAELATLDSPRASGYVIVDGVGIEVPGHPVAAPANPAELARLAYHDPARFGVDPSALAPEARAAMQANQATLAVYAGAGMADPTLGGRLADVTAPVLVVWGESDRIGDPDYGRAFAAAIPGARFELLEKCGHLPQIEAPDALLAAIHRFVTGAPGQP